MAYLENGMIDQITAPLEQKIELSGLENDGEFLKPIVRAAPPKENSQKSEESKIYAFAVKNLATSL